MNKKQLSAKRTRQLVLNAARDIISAEGSVGLTSRNLIDTAGISKGALYHHFDSLDDVVLAVINEKIELSVNQDNINSFLDSGPISVSEFLDFVESRLYRQLDGEMDNILFDVKILPKVITNNYIRCKIEQINSEWTEKLVNVLGSDLGKSEKKALIALVLATLSGLAVNHLIDRDRKAAKAQWLLFKSMVLNQFVN